MLLSPAIPPPSDNPFDGMSCVLYYHPEIASKFTLREMVSSLAINPLIHRLQKLYRELIFESVTCLGQNKNGILLSVEDILAEMMTWPDFISFKKRVEREIYAQREAERTALIDDMGTWGTGDILPEKKESRVISLLTSYILEGNTGIFLKILAEETISSPLEQVLLPVLDGIVGTPLLSIIQEIGITSEVYAEKIKTCVLQQVSQKIVALERDTPKEALQINILRIGIRFGLRGTMAAVLLALTTCIPGESTHHSSLPGGEVGQFQASK